MQIDWQKYADEYNMFMRDMRDKGRMPGRTGGMTNFPGLFIYAAARELNAQRILEIGTRNGVSACTFGRAMKENHGSGILITVDVVNVLKGEARPVDEANRFPLNPKQMMEAVNGSSIFVDFAHMRGAEALSFLQEQSQDIILIDGSHKLTDVKMEVPLARRAIRAGGVIILDDVYPNGKKLRSHEKVIHGPWEALMELEQPFERPNSDNSVAYIPC